MLLLIGVFLYPSISQAALTIEITEGIEGALPIAIVPFASQGMEQQPPIDLAGIISADLHRSGRFKTLAKEDMLTRPNSAAQVKFRNWRALGQESLVIGHVKQTGTDQYVVTFQLFDVFRGAQLTGYSIPTNGKDLRRTAHRISDIVYEKIIGERGAFATRIAYVITELVNKKRRYKLQIADSDGYNPQTMITSAEPLMSPSWAPDGSRIAYVSFEKKRPAVFVQTLRTGKREKLSSFPGINGAPAWSPDGSELALTLSKDGNPDIYILNLISKSLRKLTKSYAIDTEPAWASDNRTIVFTSDRGGKPQLYRVSVNGGKAKRLTFEGDYNARATFSPNGKSVAMVHGSEGVYRIALLDLESGNMQILTKGRLDESPSFAPNGSMILYAARQGYRGLLSAVSSDGRVSQRLVLETGEVREPAWSPF